ncbi:putative transmembrane protein [Candidatus Paraburkholderia schumanniana]|nr:putative transmembrane protein [Candidatus Paraburkholderia schumannianae]
MSALQVWLAIIGMGLVTAVTRALFLIGGERIVLPPRVQRVLRYAPAAALAGVVVPDLLETPVGISLALSNHALWASAAGLAYYLWRRGMMGTIAVGMFVFTLRRLAV